jgi:general secretion pathway protein F
VARLDRVASERLLADLAVLVEGGAPIADALVVAGHGHGPGGAAATSAIRRDLAAGLAVTPALAERLTLGPDARALLDAGLVTGRLGPALAAASERLADARRARADLLQALAYPAMLVAVALIAVTLLAVVVAPGFAGLFNARADALPDLSRAVLGTALWLNRHPLELAAGLVAIAGATAAALAHPTGRRWLADLARRLPGVGAWLTARDLAAWTGTLAALLNARADLLPALAAARARIGHPATSTRLGRLPAALRAGRGLSDALAEAGAFPADLTALVAVGERAGRVPALLATAARRAEEREAALRRALLRWIEPAAILLVGLFVGLIAAAVALAVTALGDLPV